jgi:hypothetical protein
MYFIIHALTKDSHVNIRSLEGMFNTFKEPKDADYRFKYFKGGTSTTRVYEKFRIIMRLISLVTYSSLI